MFLQPCWCNNRRQYMVPYLCKFVSFTAMANSWWEEVARYTIKGQASYKDKKRALNAIMQQV